VAVNLSGSSVRQTAGPGLSERLSRDLDAAFAEVVDAHERAVFSTALRVSGGTLDAEDLAAETFLRAYVALRSYTPERIRHLNLRPWLITICLNQWRNQIRSASRRPVTAGPAAIDRASTSESPEARTERHDTRGRLSDLLQHLPEKQRIAVVLRYVIGLRYGEIAEILHCPEGTAKSHVSRGLDRLRTLIPEVQL
jgi:RNA polymerase sigma factor (sigma-70 family)